MADSKTTVTVTVTRGQEAKTYQLTEGEGSKKGTYLTFTPAGENADMPSFTKIYVSVKRAKANGKKAK